MPSAHLQTARAVGRDVSSMRKFHGDGFKVYELALDLVKGRVLDIACGTGVGTEFLADKVEIIGVDVDAETIKYCQKHEKATFVQHDATKKLPFPDKYFDTIVTFETIEHLYPRERKKYLAQLRRVLKDKGTILLSTPQNGITKRSHPCSPLKHPYDHKIEFFLDELRKELEDAGFSIVKEGGIVYVPDLAEQTQTHKRQSAIGLAQKFTKYVPTALKERIAAPLLGHPFHVRNYGYSEEHLDKCKTFFLTLKKA